MVNKRGIFRIIEAVLGAIIVIGFLLFIMANKIQNGRNFETEAKGILDEIAKNETLRSKILLNETGIKTQLENFTRARINNPAINLSIEICELEDTCFFGGVYPGDVTEVYVSERVISTDSTIVDYNPKKIKLFLWMS